MIILGIDPGSRKTGFGIIKIVGNKFHYIDSGIIRFDHIDLFLDRLAVVYEKTIELIDVYNPTEVAVESLIYVKSPTALMKLAQARGAMIAAFNKTHQGRIFEYSPNLIKSTTTGHGHANKESVQKFLRMILGPREFKTHDESDALAIAICHALRSGPLQRPMTRSSKQAKNSLSNSL